MEERNHGESHLEVQEVGTANRGLPFIEVVLYTNGPSRQDVAVLSYALLDSGSTRNMLSERFFRAELPDTKVSTADARLLSACGAGKARINQHAE